MCRKPIKCQFLDRLSILFSIQYLQICNSLYMSVHLFLTNVFLAVYSEFQLILELCLYALSGSQRSELICATLSTLHAFLPWIPFDCIFESTLVCTSSCVVDLFSLLKKIILELNSHVVFVAQLDTLLKFFPMPTYRNLALQCLIEVCCSYTINYGFLIGSTETSFWVPYSCHTHVRHLTLLRNFCMHVPIVL